MCATGLSAVLNSWLAATPSGCGCIHKFVQYHSKFIVLIPGLLGVSTIFSATALCIGLNERSTTTTTSISSSRNAPVLLSNIGLIGTVGCCGLVGLANIRGWYMTYRLLQKSVLRMEKRLQQHHHKRRHYY